MRKCVLRQEESLVMLSLILVLEATPMIVSNGTSVLGMDTACGGR